MAIGLQANSTKRIKGRGGKAFPNQYEWACNVCEQRNAEYMEFCQYCEHEASGLPVVIG